MDNWLFEITDWTTGSAVTTTIDSPQGWEDVSVNIKRNAEFHGVFFDYTYKSLQFTDDAADILEAAYIALGIEAETYLTITWDCDTQQLFYTGKFNYHKYRKTCSFDEGCYIEMPIETSNGQMKFANRFDQKVNLDTPEDFAGNALTPYAGLGQVISLPAKGIQKTLELVRDDLIYYMISDDPTSEWVTIKVSGNLGSVAGHQNIPFSRILLDELGFSYLDTTTFFLQGANYNSGGPQTVQLFENVTTNVSSITFNIRVKGRIIWTLPNTAILEIPVGIPLNIYLVTLAGGLDPDTNPATIIASATIKAPMVFNTTQTDEFDFIYTGSLSVDYGQKVWCFIQWNMDKVGTGTFDAEVGFDAETFFEIQAITYYTPTDCKTYLINESAARITEATTDGEMTFYSDYFGRTDALPYPSAADGCGGLEIITNGLLIRNVILVGGVIPQMTISMKQLFEGLKAIHCIGMGIEDDPNNVPAKMVRFEPFSYFYNPDVIMFCLSVNTLSVETNQDGFISIFKFGYDKYEGEAYNGIDEFLTSREYRSTLSSVKNTLDATSQFIASGYTIEITREKSTDTKDWRYDDDTFIICLERDGVNLIVEQGNITNDSFIIDPPTIYNFRISPIRNAFRWLKILFANFVDINSATAYYEITNTTGNSSAGGTLVGGCLIERTDIDTQENVPLAVANIDDPLDATPLWTNERVKFTYPLTVVDYKLIEANPYGKIGFSFTNAQIQYGWIEEINYRAAEGMADFVLIMSR